MSTTECSECGSVFYISAEEIEQSFLYQKAQKELEQLKAQLKEAERVIEFYANEVNYSMGDTYKTYDRLENDTEYTPKHGGRFDMISGKRARQYMEKVK